jgi:hypothetical protein
MMFRDGADRKQSQRRDAALLRLNVCTNHALQRHRYCNKFEG